MSTVLAYLGPEGTYSEQAARACGPQARRVPYGTIAAAVRAAEQGEADEAVVPIENSLEGAVTSTVDLLIHETALKIKREIVVPIRHCLVVPPAADQARPAADRAKPATDEPKPATDEPKPATDGAKLAAQVEVVFSHPQAAAQCRGYLERCLPGARFSASLSTAAAVEDMLRSERPAVAVSSRRAAELFGAEVAAAGIEDAPHNQTRFVVLAASDAPPTGRDRTSVCFDFAHDGPGILHNALGALASRKINMLKIESRPDKRSLGRYYFLLDVAGHRTDPTVASALAEMAKPAASFRVLGSYGRAVEAGQD